MDALPVELVSSIFHWVVHTPTPSPSSPSRDAYRRALKLSHISRRLRDIAIACPSLWTSISTTHDAHHDDTTTCLARSKACALAIHFDARRLPAHKVVPISRAFAAHVSRWADAEFRYESAEEGVTGELVRLFDAAFAGGEAGALRSLDVALPRSVGTARVVSPPAAHGIERLSLTNLGFNWSRAAFPHLKELRLTGINGPEAPSLAQFASLLENAPALEVVHLKDVIPHSEDEAVPMIAAESFDNTISLPDLTSATFDAACLSLVHLVLTRVSAPALARLAIQANNAPLNLDWSAVRRDTLAEVQSFSWTSWTEGTDAHGLRIAAMFRAVVGALAGARDVQLGGGLAVREVVQDHDERRLPRMRTLECTGLKGCDLELLVSLARDRGMDRLSFSAGDFATTASVGQQAMEAVDEALDALKASVGKLDIRNRLEGCGFRYTFLGWRDYRDHQNRGRQWEYDMEYEE